jgi:hypothetical protein
MGSRSIFADESGDESARDRRTDERKPSVFRGGNETDRVSPDDDHESGDGRESGGDRDAHGEDGDGATTMTVFSGDDVFEFAVEDDR